MVHSHLSADSFDLRRLFVQTPLLAHDDSFKPVNLCLEICSLPGNGSSLFFHFAMFLKKLIKQHRVHLVVAHAVGFSFLVAYHQIRIYLFHILSYESKLRCARWINFLVDRKLTGLSAKRTWL